MLEDYQNKVCVVTGAASGIGKALCEKLVALGAQVYALDRNKADIEGLSAFVETDLSDKGSIDAAFGVLPQVIDRFFGVAGLSGARTSYWLTFTVNFIANKYMTDTYLEKRIPSGGSIAYVTSCGGLMWEKWRKEYVKVMDCKTWDEMVAFMKSVSPKDGVGVMAYHLRKQTASDPFEQISGSTGLMGVADTSWVMQRKRMSQTADILLTGRDMDDRTLHLREKNCVWTLEDEETAEEREIKTVPDYLWKVAEYIESVGNWQGTASELLAAAGIENAKPNQFTYNMAKYFDKVFEPKNIRYKTHRKNKVRLLSFYGDDGDGGDDDIDITQ